MDVCGCTGLIVRSVLEVSHRDTHRSACYLSLHVTCTKARFKVRNSRTDFLGMT